MTVTATIKAIPWALVFLLLAMLCALFAAFDLKTFRPWGPNWLALAFALFVLSLLVGRIG